MGPKRSRTYDHQIASDRATGPLFDGDVVIPVKNDEKPSERTFQIVWWCVMYYVVIHTFALHGLYFILTGKVKWLTIILAYVLYVLSIFGIGGGAHRLWAHRSFKATWQLKALFVIFNSMAYQRSVINWARDHRVHHKFQETDADPYNAKRGFFFSHMGWLMCKKHPEVLEKGNLIDMSDLHDEPLLRLQHEYYIYFVALFAFILPTIIPVYLWKESFMVSHCLNMFKYVVSLHGTWLINSVAHLWGTKPYDKNIGAVQTWFTNFFTNGEGWHNYHHTFPWDYKAAEIVKLNLTAMFINFFARIGWAYDLKTVSQELIRDRVCRTGDGSHDIWGWGDKDQRKEDCDAAVIYYRKEK